MDGYHQSGCPIKDDGCEQETGHETRAAGPPIFSCARVPLSLRCPQAAGQPRRPPCPLSRGDLRPRLLLASARGMPVCHDPQDEFRFLAAENLHGMLSAMVGRGSLCSKWVGALQSSGNVGWQETCLPPTYITWPHGSKAAKPSSSCPMRAPHRVILRKREFLCTFRD